MKTAMENLKEMVDVNVIVGDPIESPDGHVIVPISRVGFGFAAGGSEFKIHSDGNDRNDNHHQGSKELPFGGGSGGGLSINPIAFLVVGTSGVNILPLDNSTHIYERLLDKMPQLFDKVQSMLNCKKKKTDETRSQEEKQIQ
jgi:sporulation protein YtfJ